MRATLDHYCEQSLATLSNLLIDGATSPSA
jgi:hypothetical protein